VYTMNTPGMTEKLSQQLRPLFDDSTEKPQGAQA
jgi:hypothetical protein